MEALLYDLRFALRSLLRRPGFTVTATLVLALGIGAVATVASAARALLLRPPEGITEPERIVEIGRGFRGRGFDTLSYPELLDLRGLAREGDAGRGGGEGPFSAVAGWKLEPVSWDTGDGGERLTGMLVSPSYFDVLGVAPALGRLFAAGEGDPADPRPVVVLSHAFFEERFGSDPGVVGSTISLDRHPFTVAGVADPEFRGHVAGLEPALWLPMSTLARVRPGFDELQARNGNWLMVMARLAPGVERSEAAAAVDTLFARLAAEHPEVYRQKEARLLPLAPVPGGGRVPVTALLGLLGALAGALLLVTCADVAGLVAARAVASEREVALRLALGAGRARLVRQLLAETVLLFLAGGAAGVLVAVWVTGFLSGATLPVPEAPRLDLAPDPSVVAWSLSAALATGLVFGLLPALSGSRPELAGGSMTRGSALPGLSGGPRRSRLRRGFVAAQVALSLLLLVAAGLFLRSLGEAGRVDPGFDPEGVALVSFDLALDGYDEAGGLALVDRMLERVEALPEVATAAVGLDLPMDLTSHGGTVYPVREPRGPGAGTGAGACSGGGRGGDEGARAAAPDAEAGGWGSELGVVSPGYFEALRVPLLAGRGFEATDAAGASPVVVVSRTLAETAWPGEPALGKRLRFDRRDGEPATVVGVVADVKNQTLSEAVDPMVWFPLAQRYRPGLTLVARGTAGTPPARRLREAVLAADPRLSLTPVLSLASHTALGLLPQRLAAITATVAGGLALLLAALGVYGVVAFTVAQRRREVGIRLALGADRRRLLAGIVRRELLFALPGLLVGAVAALALARSARGFLLGVSPLDPLALGGGAALLTAAVLLAAWLPARRAAALPPAEALRAE